MFFKETVTSSLPNYAPPPSGAHAPAVPVAQRHMAYFILSGESPCKLRMSFFSIPYVKVRITKSRN